jgi:hypothetical protein
MLEAARGSIRDALGAVRNVEQLLRSIKVGPKALASVIPDVHASCGPLLESFRLLLNVIEPHEPAAVRALDAFVAPRVGELEAALAPAAKGPISASTRLKLEHAVTRVVSDLEAARGLLELLEDAVSGGRARVDLLELVGQTLRATDNGSARSNDVIRATLSSSSSVEVSVSPRATMSLVTIGLKLVVGKDHSIVPHVEVKRLDGMSGLFIQRATGQGEKLLVTAPRLVDPTLECVSGATHAMGGTLERSKDGTRVSFLWPSVED